MRNPRVVLRLEPKVLPRRPQANADTVTGASPVGGAFGKGGPVAPLLLWSAAQLSLALGLLAATGTRSLTR